MKKSNNNEVDIRVAIDGAEHKFVEKHKVVRPCDECSMLEYCKRLTPDEMLCEILYGNVTNGNFVKVKDVDTDADFVVIDGKMYDTDMNTYVVLNGVVYNIVNKSTGCGDCQIRKHCEKAWHNAMNSMVCFALRDALTPNNHYFTLCKRKEKQ